MSHRSATREKGDCERGGLATPGDGEVVSAGAGSGGMEVVRLRGHVHLGTPLGSPVCCPVLDC